MHLASAGCRPPWPGRPWITPSHAVHLDVGRVVAMDEVHPKLLPDLERDAENEVDDVGIGSVGTRRRIRVALQPGCSRAGKPLLPCEGSPPRAPRRRGRLLCVICIGSTLQTRLFRTRM